MPEISIPALLPLNVICSFFLAALVLGIAPGPDNIFVLTQSSLYGAKAGICTTFGLTTGLFVHTAAVAFGVAALIVASSFAFTILKILGASYLLYLAWLSWKAGSVSSLDHTIPFPGYTTLYLRGIIMNVTNPKVTLFFLAFLPQFADPQRGSMLWQISQLGALFMLATVLVFCSVALLGGRLASWFTQSPRGQVGVQRLAACIFVLLALFLLLSGT